MANDAELKAKIEKTLASLRDGKSRPVTMLEREAVASIIDALVAKSDGLASVLAEARKFIDGVNPDWRSSADIDQAAMLEKIDAVVGEPGAPTPTPGAM